MQNKMMVIQHIMIVVTILLSVIWRNTSAYGSGDCSTALISAIESIITSNSGNAVINPMVMVRLLWLISCAPTEGKSLKKHLHHLR